MEKAELKKHLLSTTSDDGFFDDDVELEYINSKRTFAGRLKKYRFFIVTFALISSLVANSVLLVGYRHAKGQIHLCVSEYTGLGLTTKAKYWQHTEYMDKNRTVSDPLWDNIDTSPNTIAVDRDYARKHNLDESVPFPWDQSKSLYFMKAFHHMHCLKNLRRAYVDAMDSHPGTKPFIPSEHVYHCLDIFRQDVMCRPDDTLMPGKHARHTIGDGQERKCKDWDALVRWTQDPKRHACFKMRTDYRRVHTLEQFQYCRDDSPYKGIMEDYFEKHGHKNLYLDDDDDDGNEGGPKDDY